MGFMSAAVEARMLDFISGAAKMLAWRLLCSVVFIHEEKVKKRKTVTVVYGRCEFVGVGIRPSRGLLLRGKHFLNV